MLVCDRLYGHQCARNRMGLFFAAGAQHKAHAPQWLVLPVWAGQIIAVSLVFLGSMTRTSAGVIVQSCTSVITAVRGPAGAPLARTAKPAPVGSPGAGGREPMGT